MSAKNKARGTTFERRVVSKAQEAGKKSERMWGSDGRSRGYTKDVDLTIDSKKLQAKKRKRLPGYLQVPEGCDAVVFSQDYGEILVLVKFDEYLNLIG